MMTEVILSMETPECSWTGWLIAQIALSSHVGAKRASSVSRFLKNLSN